MVIIWSFCWRVVAFISLLSGLISKKDTPKSSWVKFMSLSLDCLGLWMKDTPPNIYTLKVGKRREYCYKVFEAKDSRRHLIYEECSQNGFPPTWFWNIHLKKWRPSNFQDMPIFSSLLLYFVLGYTWRLMHNAFILEISDKIMIEVYPLTIWP